MRSRRRRQRVPYGYKLTDTGKEVQCPEAQAVISRIVLDHWTGYSFGMIASCLTDEGVKAPGGGDKWHGSGVERKNQEERAKLAAKEPALAVK